jgi:oxidase EvaA
MLLRQRESTDVADRLARSASVTYDGALTPNADIPGWLEQRADANSFSVDPVPLSDLTEWSLGPHGNLVHRSGRFFSVEGLHIVASEGPFGEWQQPIIVQPEIGILGILVKEFDGVPHFLMQAKMEPGNCNLVQLSPTVQATRSNYTAVHKGARVKYLDYFTGHRPSRILVDVLQSEHGAWFFHKANRNMIVETDEDVPLDPDFRWLTLGQIGRLLLMDNVVNMDSRTVLACAPLQRYEPDAVLSDTDLVSWFTAEQSRHDVRSRLIPLTDVSGWTISDRHIEHEQGRYFRVIAVRARATNREVSSWEQPLLEPLGSPVAAFLMRRFHGVLHLLVHARVEGGLLRTVELAPTVQCTPEFHHHLPAHSRPRFVDAVLNAPQAAIRYSAVQSEEGGRFFHPESRYLLVEATEQTAPSTPPTGFQWVTLGQLNSLVRHSHYVNVQTRTLLSVFNSGAVDLW